MAKFDYTLTDADVGRVLSIANGFLTDVRMTTPPSGYETPRWSEGAQKWLSAYFVLRGSGDYRDLVSFNPSQSGGVLAWSGSIGGLLTDGNLPFRGDLTIVCLPRGSVWEVSVSDTPNVRAPRPYSDGANFGDYPSYRHGVGRPILPLERERERELVQR
jgi:hypothetical protein